MEKLKVKVNQYQQQQAPEDSKIKKTFSAEKYILMQGRQVYLYSWLSYTGAIQCLMQINQALQTEVKVQ